MGPIFSDGTFKYVPVGPDDCPNCPTYRELGLERFVHRGKEDSHVHCDPEFDTNTYGDWSGRKRTFYLAKLDEGDYIFFLSSLRHYKTGKRLDWVDPNWAYYIIGYFRIEEILRDVRFTPEIIDQFGNNAHILRGDSGFDLYRGTSDSGLLKYPIPMSSGKEPNEFARKILKHIKGLRWWQEEVIEGARLEILLNKIENAEKFKPSKRKRKWAVNLKKLAVLVNQANNLLGSGQYAEALKPIQQAHQFQPKNASTLLTWGVVLSQLGQYTKACEKFQKAAQLHPEDSNIFFKWGVALFYLDQYEEACEKYERAAQLQPEDAAPFYNWGFVLAELDQHAEACEKYERAHQLQPENADILVKWGKALGYLSQFTESCEKFQRAHQLRPDHAPTLILWGGALSQLGRNEEAEEKLQRADELQPNDEDIE